MFRYVKHRKKYRQIISNIKTQALLSWKTIGKRKSMNEIASLLNIHNYVEKTTILTRSWWGPQQNNMNVVNPFYMWIIGILISTKNAGNIFLRKYETIPSSTRYSIFISDNMMLRGILTLTKQILDFILKVYARYILMM